MYKLSAIPLINDTIGIFTKICMYDPKKNIILDYNTFFVIFYSLNVTAFSKASMWRLKGIDVLFQYSDSPGVFFHLKANIHQ